jgi:thioredoxin 1
MIGPIVEEVAQEYKGRLRVVKVNVDENPATPQSLGIMGIPTLILFKGGAEVSRIVGYRAKETLVEELLPHIG